MNETNTTGGNGEAVATSVGLPGGALKHTPGPWRTGEAQWNDAGEAMYTLHGISQLRCADAKLIAAAPDLLMALLADRLVARYEDPWCDDVPGVTAQMQQMGYESPGHEGELAEEWIARVKRAAITKALGTEPGNQGLDGKID